MLKSLSVEGVFTVEVPNDLADVKFDDVVADPLGDRMLVTEF